jgi:hypothetical protein
VLGTLEVEFTITLRVAWYVMVMLLSVKWNVLASTTTTPPPVTTVPDEVVTLAGMRVYWFERVSVITGLNAADADDAVFFTTKVKPIISPASVYELGGVAVLVMIRFGSTTTTGTGITARGIQEIPLLYEN